MLPSSPQLLIQPYRAAVAAVASTTWDPAKKSANITLTNGNLTATCTSFAFNGVKSVKSNSTGKFYFEHRTVHTASSLDSLGIANATAALGTQMGTDTNSCSYVYNGAASVKINGSTIGTPNGSSTDGDLVAMAVDLGAQLIWFKVNALNWNNNGSADPATGVGGFSLATLAAGPYFIMAGVIGNTSSFTADFGGTAFSNTPPSGYGNW